MPGSSSRSRGRVRRITRTTSLVHLTDRVLHAAARLVRGGGRRPPEKSRPPWPWAEAKITPRAWQRIDALPLKHLRPARTRPSDQRRATRGPGVGTPGHPARQPGHGHTPALRSGSQNAAQKVSPATAINPDERSGLISTTRIGSSFPKRPPTTTLSRLAGRGRGSTTRTRTRSEP